MAKPQINDKDKEILHAKDYKDRDELDKTVRTIYGMDFEKNKETAIIKGSKEQLKRLHLSENTTVYGVTVKIT